MASNISTSWNKHTIFNVWQDNIYQAFDEIQEAVLTCPYIAMDTEFPGVLVRPILSYRDAYQYRYFTTKANVDMLKVIQVGITLLKEDGSLRDATSTWCFNFKFDLDSMMYSDDSIELLKNGGIDFNMHKRKGIDPATFGELLITSGLVLTDQVQWICFHGAYDFAYVLRLLTGQTTLPDEEKTFFELLSIYFPNIVDIKYLTTLLDDFNRGGGLSALGQELSIRRVGKTHTAGSDSRLTGDIFFILKDNYFNHNIDEQHLNWIYGLGSLQRLLAQI